MTGTLQALAATAFALALTTQAEAQTGEPAADRLTITATARQTDRPVATSIQLDTGDLAASAPVTLADVLTRVGTANLTTNSRGESLVYLRNAGERQSAILFDGAPLNIAWDNRVSLSRLPVIGIGEIRIESGGTSAGLGRHAAGGLIAISTQRPGTGGAQDGRFRLQIGTGDQFQASTLIQGSGNSHSALIAVDHSQRAGLPGNGDEDIQANTDARSSSGLAVLRRRWGHGGEAAITLLHTDARHGIAAAGYDRPSQGRPRYWRYPDARQTLASGRLQFPGTRAGRLTLNAWHQTADTVIEDYADAAYSILNARQADADRTSGARLTWSSTGEGSRQQWSAGWSSADHRQTETGLRTTRFSNRDWHLAWEGEQAIAARQYLSAAAGYMVMDAGETGGRPGFGRLDGWHASLAHHAHFRTGWSIETAAHFRTRLPTMRELYGTAINRFALNPGLGPETITTLESAILHETERLRFSFIPFYTRSRDTLDQENVVINGTTLRRRINLDGSEAFGVEAGLELALGGGWSWEIDGLATHLRRTGSQAATTGPYIAERPSRLVQSRLNYDHGNGMHATIEARHRGGAWSFTDEDVFEPLPASTVVNLRLRARPFQSGGPGWDVFLHADNLGDAEELPQLGLPAPGRSLRAGISLAFGG